MIVPNSTLAGGGGGGGDDATLRRARICAGAMLERSARAAPTPAGPRGLPPPPPATHVTCSVSLASMSAFWLSSTHLHNKGKGRPHEGRAPPAAHTARSSAASASLLRTPTRPVHCTRPLLDMSEKMPTGCAPAAAAGGTAPASTPSHSMSGAVSPAAPSLSAPR